MDKSKDLQDLVDYAAFKQLKNTGFQMTPTPKPISETSSEAPKSVLSDTSQSDETVVPDWYKPFMQ